MDNGCVVVVFFAVVLLAIVLILPEACSGAYQAYPRPCNLGCGVIVFAVGMFVVVGLVWDAYNRSKRR